MLIDFHTHCFPDNIAPKARLNLSSAAGLVPVTEDFTAKGLADFAKKDHVDFSVVLNIATKPSQNIAVNRFAAQIDGKAGIIAFGSVYPGADDTLEALEFIRAAGLKGIKLHPDYQDFYTDDEKKAYPVYEFCERHGLIVVFHAGVDLGIPPPVRNTPDRLLRVVKAFPKLKAVAAHLGGYLCWDMAAHFLAGSGVYMDTSYILKDLAPKRARDIITKHGAERILLGSDYPWESAADTVAYIKALELGEKAEQMILGENAARLLGL